MTDLIKTPTDVLSHYWPQATLPINPTEIAIAAGINVRPFSRDDDPLLSGEYIPVGDDGKPVIFFNSQESENRQRFTIAHELGHHFLNHGQRYRDTRETFGTYNPCEIAANKFAADILMPRVYLDILINKKNITNPRKLTELFQVSEAAMNYRLQNLGFICS